LFSPYRLKSAQSSRNSLIEPSIPRISSESNLQLLRTEEQARLIPTGLNQARNNVGQKFAVKNQSTTSIASEPADISVAATSKSHKHIPTPILINVSNASPSLREKHMSLVGRTIDSPKAAAATSTNTTTAIATLEIPLPYSPYTGPNGVDLPTDNPPRKNLGTFVSSTYGLFIIPF
jgi:hypothetical protein